MRQGNFLEISERKGTRLLEKNILGIINPCSISKTYSAAWNAEVSCYLGQKGCMSRNVKIKGEKKGEKKI